MRSKFLIVVWMTVAFIVADGLLANRYPARWLVVQLTISRIAAIIIDGEENRVITWNDAGPFLADKIPDGMYSVPLPGIGRNGPLKEDKSQQEDICDLDNQMSADKNLRVKLPIYLCV